MSFRSASRRSGRGAPERLIAARKAAARRNYDAVRTAVQAMKQRGMARDTVTVAAVAEESGVPKSTIYRRDDLFALVQKLNPAVQRRAQGDGVARQVEALREELAEARREAAYCREQSQLVEIGARRRQQEDVQTRKRVLELDREVERLREQLKLCTCGAADSPVKPVG